jgi:Tol biopolymer transport system component
LVYRSANEAPEQFAWFNREGVPFELVPASGAGDFQSLAPDGRQVALARFDAQGGDIWLMDLRRGTTSRFTSGPTTEWFPVWAPNQDRVVFASDPEGRMDLYQKALNGGKEELLLTTPDMKLPTDWSSDGRFIVYHSVNSNTMADLWVLPLGGERRPIPCVQTQFDEFDGAFSPDGKWIGYTSSETGRFEVYVQPSPGSNTQPSRGKWQVSTQGGSRLRWGRDGKEVFYVTPDGDLVAVPVMTGREFAIGVPKKLFRTNIGNPTPTTSSFGYGTAGGRRFLTVVPTPEPIPASVTVVLNWTGALRKSGSP